VSLVRYNSVKTRGVAQGAAFFHSEDLHYLKFLIPEVELGRSTGDLLAELKPSFNVGIDLNSAAIEDGRHRSARPYSITTVRSCQDSGKQFTRKKLSSSMAAV
jgi:hypothetical protein